MRILGFLEIVLCLFTVLVCQLIRTGITTDGLGQTVERRLPPKVHRGSLVNLSVLKSWPYSLYCLSCFTAFLGIYTVSWTSRCRLS